MSYIIDLNYLIGFDHCYFLKEHRLYQDTTICAPKFSFFPSLTLKFVWEIGKPVKCYSKRLEAFLASRVPNLHCHLVSINNDVLCKEIGSNCSLNVREYSNSIPTSFFLHTNLVVVAKPFVHILVHQRSLSNA
jgi:hypothetical protein